MKLLHIDSSITGANSVSRELTQFVVDQLRQQNEQVQVEHVDLALNPPPHFSADSLGMRLGLDPATLTERQRAENAITEQYLGQFLASDVVVIGAPFYNFTIPSQLKAWMDRLAQAGRTFRYTSNGPEGLAGDKTVYLVLSRGGIYSESEQGQAMEHQESYLRVMFGFMGVTDLRIVYAEGLGKTPELRDQIISNAKASVSALLEKSVA